MSRQLEQTIAEAAAKNMSVAATIEWLADMELEARQSRAIERRFKSSRLLSQPSIDAFHFHQTSNLFYQVIPTRHSHKRSTIMTTNTAFSDWGNILFNTTIATAIADRLVENSEIFLLGGESIRKTNKSGSPISQLPAQGCEQQFGTESQHLRGCSRIY